MHLQITIDGPSGVGKSTLSKALADSLGYLFLNTGLIFRGLAWYFLKEGIEDKDISAAIERLTKRQNFKFDRNRWFLDGQPVPENLLITQEISGKAAGISKNREVRAYVLQIEKDVAKEHNIVIEGRDIGTAVFPNAILKIFLTASEEIRGERRYNELKAKGLLGNKTQEDIRREIALRDREDSEREIAPLVKPEDAVVLNSDHKSKEMLVEEIKQILRERISK